MPPVDRGSALTDDLIEAIREAVAEGNYLTTAAHLNGISRNTLYGWNERAVEVKMLLQNGELRRNLTKHDKQCLKLATAIQEAEAQSEHTLRSRVALASQPRRVRKIVRRTEPVRDRAGIVRDNNGDVVMVNTITTTDEEVFDWRAALEMLKRRHGDKWGDKANVEVSGPGGGAVVMQIPDQPTDRETMASIADAFVEAGLMDAAERALFDAGDDSI